jgi:16S rRNA G966 N2-methylase RsmD
MEKRIMGKRIMEKRIMNLQKILMLLVAAIGAASLGVAGCTGQKYIVEQAETEQDTTQTQLPKQPQARQVSADVPYVPTPQPVVDAMLNLAKVSKDDVLYDLGSGDGRIVVTAAERFGTRGTGIDIDPQRIEEANANAKQAGVTNKVKFLQQDLFNTDLSKATVVTLYLLPQVNNKLRPKLLSQLKPGTRIVSHEFDMGEWKPERTIKVRGPEREHTIYYWTVPQNPPANLQ